jgi:hypothetical protein
MNKDLRFEELLKILLHRLSHLIYHFRDGIAEWISKPILHVTANAHHFIVGESSLIVTGVSMTL